MSMGSTFETQERLVLDRLREQFESDGYEFVVHPVSLPSFLGDYRPDAIALKGNGGVVIEVKSRRHSGADKRLSELTRLFVDQADWRFDVVYSDAPTLVPQINAYPRGRTEEEL